jgi:16S rRNA (guanine527-N7)-methyltransferase
VGADDRHALRRSLHAATERLGIAVPPVASERLLDFVDLLSRWNRTYNLTSVREPASMLTQHVVDCLAAVGPLRRLLPAGQRRRILDVGSGGGLPGVVFAVMEPDSDVTCVDSVGKKVAFVQQVAATLRLPNLHALHNRVEQIAGTRFDVITSRAFASLAKFTTLTAPLLDEGGVWMAMKGKEPRDELAELSPAVHVFHVEHLDVPGLDAERCLVWMRPLRSRGTDEASMPESDG